MSIFDDVGDHAPGRAGALWHRAEIARDAASSCAGSGDIREAIWTAEATLAVAALAIVQELGAIRTAILEVKDAIDDGVHDLGPDGVG